jgi:hypothetical protein
MKRILLIEPPFYRLFKKTYALVKYPLSLAYLAAAVKSKTTWDVRAYNADFAPTSDPFEVTYFKGKGFAQYLENLRNASGNIWREMQSVIAAYSPSVVGISAKSANFASAVQVARLVKEMFPETVVVVGGPHPTTVRDRSPGQNHKVDIRAPSSDSVDNGQGSEYMTQANGIVGINKNAANSVCNHYVVALKDGW